MMEGQLMPYNSNFGSFMTPTLQDIWPDEQSFSDDYNANQINHTLKAATVTQIYYLLYAQYGNNNIASTDVNQFKYQVFSIMFTHGLTWERKVEIQASLRGLTNAQLEAGTKMIVNHAYNPDTTPGVTDVEELTYISEQNSTNTKRGSLEAYNALIMLLENDLTTDFLSRFKALFLRIVYPQAPLWYESED